MKEKNIDSAANWRAVMAEIARAASDVERDPSCIELVCISKTSSAEEIMPVLEAGQRVFGENRVKEALGKWPALREKYPGTVLHLIGPLQTNKVREAVELFDVIETLDRPRLAMALAAELQCSSRRPEIFVQVNTGSEPQKAGVFPQAADEFLLECRDVHKLAIAGLMCIPPAGEQASPHFALLAQIAKRNGIGKLSMGMSSDFALGIQLGATHVRIGSAIFGARS